MGECVLVGSEHATAIKDLHTRLKVNDDKLENHNSTLQLHWKLIIGILAALVVCFILITAGMYFGYSNFQVTQQQRQPQEMPMLEQSLQGNDAKTV